MVLWNHHAVAPRLVVPRKHAQKILQRPRRHTGREGHRLDAFTRQVRKLAADVRRQVHSRIFPSKAIGKLTQELVQTGFETPNLSGIRAMHLLLRPRKHGLCPWQRRSFADFRKFWKTDLAL